MITDKIWDSIVAVGCCCIAAYSIGSMVGANRQSKLDAKQIERVQDKAMAQRIKIDDYEKLLERRAKEIIDLKVELYDRMTNLNED